MVKGRYRFAFFLIILLILCIGILLAAQAPKGTKPDSTGWNGDFTEGWKQFDQLLKEQKNEAASALVEKMLESARAEENDTEWTRCLVRDTALRISLHGYENASRLPWIP